MYWRHVYGKRHSGKTNERSPAAPFTTSTLQQEASRKLGYGVSRTMLVAQKLYESGQITYMRTDSVALSDTAMEDIQHTVKKSFGDRYYQARRYKNKNESAQEAHEAIRPTSMAATTVSDPDGRRLYELIWKRTMASQMADAELEKTIAKIDISTNKAELIASGEVMKFEGFIKIYREDRDDEDLVDGEEGEGMLPPLRTGRPRLITSRSWAPYAAINVVEALGAAAAHRPAFEPARHESNGTLYTSATSLHRSIVGKKTGRTWHRPAIHVCAYYLNDFETWLCRKA